MVGSRSLKLVLTLAAAATVACSGPQDESSRRVLGLIDNGAAGDPLALPDTVYAGASFVATVTTWGSPCNRADGAKVVLAGLLADVTPYDLLPPPGTTCITSIRAFPRPVTLTFLTPGAATVRLHGRDATTDTVTVARSLLVLPQ